jgi:hypothetical protein
VLPLTTTSGPELRNMKPGAWDGLSRPGAGVSTLPLNSPLGTQLVVIPWLLFQRRMLSLILTLVKPPGAWR